MLVESACGTGRLLLPIAQSGVTIHGLDSSAHVLDVLQRRVAKLDITGAELNKEPMEGQSSPSRHDAIFVTAGSFRLLALLESALNSLQCVRSQLADGRLLLVDLFIPWDNILAQRRASYHVTRDVVRPDGRRSIVLERSETEIPAQIKRGTCRCEFYDWSHLADCITDDVAIRWYWKDEFTSLLSRARFSRIDVLSDSPLYGEGRSYVIRVFR